MKEIKVTTKLYEKDFIKNQRTIPVEITSDSQGIYLKPKGYGDCSSADGHGIPIMLELYGDKLRLLVWSNIMQEDPTHIIDLEDAREDKPLRVAEINKQKADSMVFEFRCAWDRGTAKRTLGEAFNDKSTKSLISIYGKDIYSECASAEIGQTVKWEEPFNGWVKAKRVK